MKNGLLLINLGTPDYPTVTAVRRYLREFLSDKRVVSLPAPLRYLLLYGVILPFRPRRSAHAYQAIWGKNGSPLLYNSRSLANRLQERFDGRYQVALGMLYGKPRLEDALAELQGCDHLTILPLYPQYSSATTGAAIEKGLSLLSSQLIFPSLRVIRDFYSHPSYIHAQSALIKPHVANHDYILFSYHGLPESHILKSGCQSICITDCPISPPKNRVCYRAQCMQTTALLAEALGLSCQKYSTSFQSMLGKTPWIKPHTNDILPHLRAQNIKRLAVSCPSFVADCLETLEEIGIGLKQQWINLGGEELTLIPCLNDHTLWVEAILDIICSTN